MLGDIVKDEGGRDDSSEDYDSDQEEGEGRKMVTHVCTCMHMYMQTLTCITCMYM